jgi:hypothetical protein
LKEAEILDTGSDCRLFNNDLDFVNENRNTFELHGATSHFIHNSLQTMVFLCCVYSYGVVGINVANWFTAWSMDNVESSNAQESKTIQINKGTKQKLYKTNAAVWYNKMRIISRIYSLL